MKNIYKILGIIALVMIVMSVLTGCATVRISSAGNQTSMIAGKTLALRASGSEIEWSVSSTADGSGPVAAGTSVSPNGLLTVDINETASFLYITARSAKDDKKDTFQVRLVTITDVTVSSADEVVVKGRTAQFRAQVTGTNNPETTVTWKVSSNAAGTNPAASGTTVSSGGLLTVAAGETSETLYVIATSTVDDTKSGSAPIRVVTPTVAAVTITTETRQVRIGTTLQFAASVTGTYEPPQNVTWRVSPTQAGTGTLTEGTGISAGGLLTVAGNETTRTLYVFATSVFDPTKSISVPVTVIIPTVTAVAISPERQSVRAGETLQFTASVTGTNEPPQNVTWRINSNQAGTGAVTEGTGISASGLLTVAKNESLRTLYVFATSVYDPTKSAVIPVTLIIPTVDRVTVTPATRTLTAGQEFMFFADVRGTNDPDTEVTWKVSSNAAGTGPVTAGTAMAADGTLTIAAGETARTLYVFATSVFNPAMSGTSTITVTPAPAAPQQ